MLSTLYEFSYVIFTDIPFDHTVGGGGSSRSGHRCCPGTIVIVTPVLQMRKLNLREVKSLAKGHAA